MTPNDSEEPTDRGSDWFNFLMNRPWECSALHMELKTAMEFNDVASCRVLLAEKGHWLAKLQGHELTELMDAAIGTGDAADELMDLLLESGIPPHCIYDHIGPSYQHTPLMTAAGCGRLDLVKKLASAGAELLWKSPTGANALSGIFPSRACQDCVCDTPERAEVREWLLQQGLRIDPLCPDSRRKLLWASSNPESWPDVPALMQLGIPVEATGWTPFMLELASGLADVQAVVNLTDAELHHRDGWERTPFLLAVAAGDLDLAKALLERGSDLEAKSHCNHSALHLAAENNHCSLIDWLLEIGLPLDVENEFGDSALHDAVAANRVEAAALLLQKGADVRERDTNDYGLIHDVSFTEDLAMLKLLLNAGADVNDVSGGGNWPLHDACEQGNTDAVAFLLAAGADPNLTSTGKTAIFAAVSSDSLECVCLLLQAGADVNATDCDGWTCLFHLRSEGMARLLLENGASPEIADQAAELPEAWGGIPIPVRRLLKEWRMHHPSKPSIR